MRIYIIKTGNSAQTGVVGLADMDCDGINLMISTRELVKHISHLPQNRLSILLEIQNIVAVSAPTATVELRRYGVVYYDGARGGPVSAGICQTLIKPGHIRLAFIHGAFLPDPRHLLQGSTFPKRYLPIQDYDSAPWDYIEFLIKAHSQFDPYSLLPGEVEKAREKKTNG